MRSVCVFCGSQTGVLPEYVDAAREVGQWLASHDMTTIFGGGQVGMMGALADAALAAGGRVIGVIPEHLVAPEVAHPGVTEMIVVDSMHTRKRVMAERADAFVVLPGGYGTLDETFEMVTWLQLQLHATPVGAVNVNGYFDHLLAFLAHAAEQGFIRPPHRNLLLVEPSASSLLQRLQMYQPAVTQAGDLQKT